MRYKYFSLRGIGVPINCMYYKSCDKRLVNKKVIDHKTTIDNIIPIKWCVHKHSKVSRKRASGPYGEGKLTCCGNVKQCMLLPEERADELINDR